MDPTTFRIPVIALEIDKTIHLGDVIMLIVGSIFTLIGYGIRRSWNSIAHFVRRIDTMDRRLEDAASIIDIHTEAMEAHGWFNDGTLGRVSKTRRANDRIKPGHIITPFVIAAGMAAVLYGCGPIPPPQPPQPPQPPVYCAAPSVKSASGIPVQGARADIGGLTGYTNADGYVYISPVPAGDQTLTVTADRFVPYSAEYQINSWHCDIPVQLQSTVKPLPPPPTRDQILSAQETFQGLTVHTGQYGDIPYYGAPYSSLNQADRDSVRSQLKAAGDQAIGLTVSWNYCGQAYGFCYPVPGRDLAYDLTALTELAREIAADGMYVNLRMACDGMSVNADPQQGQYNDPVGWTYGYEWCMANTSRIIGAFVAAGLAPYTVFQPGYDGVVPGWPEPQYSYPGKLDNWLLLARSTCPTCYIGVEFAAGYAHWGCEGGCFTTSAGQALDIIYQEFNIGPYESSNMDQVWQIAARHLGPAYTRGPGQPVDDDPGAPYGANDAHYYLRYGTPRGPYYVNALEFDTYLWVRNRIGANDVQKDAQYLRARGYRIIGLKVQ